MAVGEFVMCEMRVKIQHSVWFFDTIWVIFELRHFSSIHHYHFILKLLKFQKKTLKKALNYVKALNF